MQRLRYATFTSNDSWVAPAGVSVVLLFGRGGSAGGAGTSNAALSHVQGGGGCWSTMQIASVVPNTSYTITIGAAGTGGTGDGSTTVRGTGGGDTTFGAIATWKGATAAPANDLELSHGLTFGGNGSELSSTIPTNGHQLLGGQRSPFAIGGAGDITGNVYRGGGGAGDGAGGAASHTTTGGSGVSGGGGGAGNSTGGDGTVGQVIVGWIE